MNTAPSPIEEKHTPQRIKVDTATMEIIAGKYPERVRESVLWLSEYFRENCNRSQDVLVERVRKLGFKKTKNYFYQIFTGRYFNVKIEGDDDPTGQCENFIQIVDKMRGAYLVSKRAGKVAFIETGTYKKIANYIEVKRMPDTVCRFGVVIGPTGGQKTASFQHYCELNNHGLCVHLEAPEKPSISRFISDLAMRYGGSRHDNSGSNMRLVLESVKANKTIIVDNTQRLRRKDSGTDQPIFHLLQKIQDETGCTVILSFTPDDVKFLTEGCDAGYFEQFEGRAGGREKFLVLDDYAPKDDVLKIADAFGLRNAKDHYKVLDKLARKNGRIRILFDALQEAKRKANDRHEALTVEHLFDVRPELRKEEYIEG